MQHAAPRNQGHRGRRGRRPSDRPIGGRQSQTDAVPGGKAAGNTAQRNLHAVGFAWLKRLGVFIAVAVRQIQQAVADTQRAAIRRYVAQPRGEQGLRLVAANVEFEFGFSHYLQRVFQRCGVETHTLCVVDTLVIRQVGAQAVRTLVASLKAGGLSAVDGHVAGWADLRLQKTIDIQGQCCRAHTRRGPCSFSHPAARPVFYQLGRLDPAAHPHAQHRLVHDAGVFAFEPVVPPAHCLLHETDDRARARHVRPTVRPGADQRLLGRTQMLQQREQVARIAVLPAAHGIHGGRDSRIVLTHRARFPVVVAALVAQPYLGGQGGVLQTLQPHATPALSHHGRVGRPRRAGEQGAAPTRVAFDQTAAHVVAVAVVAVVHESHRQDGFERGWLQRRHLKSVDATPANPPHAHVAIAPGLARQPGDDRHAVVLLGQRVFVQHQAFGVASAADVHAHRRVAVSGQVGLGDRITVAGAVAPPVRQVFEHGRYRVGLGIHRQPDACGEPGAIGHRNPLRHDFPCGMRELRDGFHRCGSRE